MKTKERETVEVVRERERESNDLKNLVVLISVTKKQKRNINIRNRDSPLCGKIKRSVCFAT